ncbi:MAG TPA: class I SAM-dependent RNA methyltransferase [Aggregatilineales bacterium]|nr:class I SAM-dependent RNA methyltransferase [Aggregatilineales bacterium]
MTQSETSDVAEFELELTGMAYGGSAVGRHEGRAIFVPYAIPGERITARISQDKGRFAYAQGVTLLEGSEARVAPRCPHFGPGRCGGCHWQHIDYAAQLEFKQEVVRDQLARIGGLPDVTVNPTIASPDPWQYRSSVTLHLTAEGKLGFVSTDDQTVIPIQECHIIRPELFDLFESLDLEALAGLTQVKLQVGSDGEDRSVILSTEDDAPPEVESDIPASVNFLSADESPFTLVGSPHVQYTIRGRPFRVTAGSFFQVNLPQAEVLVDQVLTRLALKGTETVLDLYSGVGLFSAFIAAQASLVTAIESYPTAVDDAEFNLNDLENVDLIEGDVEGALAQIQEHYNAAVVDPPRAGIEGKALDELARLAPSKIVYVSCDPATFARDVKRLSTHGYRLLDVQPVDMFPQTYHVELVATLQLEEIQPGLRNATP